MHPKTCFPIYEGKKKRQKRSRHPCWSLIRNLQKSKKLNGTFSSIIYIRPISEIFTSISFNSWITICYGVTFLPFVCTILLFNN